MLIQLDGMLNLIKCVYGSCQKTTKNLHRWKQKRAMYSRTLGKKMICEIILICFKGMITFKHISTPFSVRNGD